MSSFIVPAPSMRPRTIQQLFFITIVVIVTLAFLGVVRDFLQPVFWAAVLAILFWPLQRRVREKFRGRDSLAALATLLLILVIVILPLSLVGAAVTNEAIGVYNRIASGEIDVQEPLERVERALPRVRAFLDNLGVDTSGIRENLSNAAVTVSRYLASQAVGIGQNALRVTVLFFLMLYLLFFFLRDGEKILDSVIRALPIGDRRERMLFAKFAQVARATIKGTLVIGAVQGTLGGLIFWILGIGAPLFWGVVMTLLSILPAIGSALVWVPAAIILFAGGHYIKALVLIVFGTLVIGLVDNLLRPVLVGRDTKMPDYLVLLSTLGGLTVFGITGFVIGPVIAALFLAVWDMFAIEYSSLDDPDTTKEAIQEGEDLLVVALDAPLETPGALHRSEEESAEEAPPQVPPAT